MQEDSIKIVNKRKMIQRKDYFVVEKDKNEKRRQSSRGEGMEGLEEENKLEILRNLLESETNTGEGDTLGNIEKEREEKDRQDVEDERRLAAPYCQSFLYGLWF